MSRIAPRRAAIAIALVVLVTLPVWVGNPTTSISRARSCSSRCSRSRSTSWSATPAWSRSAMPGCSPWPAMRAALMLQAGHGHLAADLAALAVTLVAAAVFAVLALRATGIGFLMITLGARPDRLGHRLSLGEPHQRRQRRQRVDPAGAVRDQPVERAPVLLRDAGRLPARGGDAWPCSCARRSGRACAAPATSRAA